MYRYLVYIAVLALCACRRTEPTSWDVDVLGPLAHGRITLDDMVADSLLEADGEGLWHIVLHEDLTDLDLDSLVAIPDTLIEKTFEVPLTGGPFNLPNGTEIINEEENNLIHVNDVELREVRIKSGKLRYKLSSYINGYLVCNYELPGVSLNGVGTVIEAITTPSTGDVPFVQEGEIDLAGYRIDLTGATGFMHNRIYSHFTIMTAPDAPQQAQVYGDDIVTIELEFIDPRVEYARGYFGHHLYALDQTISFGEDIQMPSGSLQLEGASMQMHITNAVGADISLDFNALQSYNSSTENSVELDYDPIMEPINITRAEDLGGYVAPQQYEYMLDAATSNIDQFIENLPDQLVLQAIVEVNPLGDVSDGNDFIYTDNALHALIDLDIPLAVGMQDLALRDTLLINSSIGLTADGKLVLYVDNAFPFEASVQAHMLDGNGNTSYSLVSGGVISAALETGTPGVTVPVTSVVTLHASQEVIQAFVPGKRIVIEVSLQTSGYPDVVKLYEDYYMDFRVIADGNVTVSFD